MSAKKKLTVDEYVAKCKAELDKFAAEWKAGEPSMYPAKLTEGDWGDQELSARFGMAP